MPAASAHAELSKVCTTKRLRTTLRGAAAGLHRGGLRGSPGGRSGSGASWKPPCAPAALRWRPSARSALLAGACHSQATPQLTRAFADTKIWAESLQPGRRAYNTRINVATAPIGTATAAFDEPSESRLGYVPKPSCRGVCVRTPPSTYATSWWARARRRGACAPSSRDRMRPPGRFILFTLSCLFRFSPSYPLPSYHGTRTPTRSCIMRCWLLHGSHRRIRQAINVRSAQVATYFKCV